MERRRWWKRSGEFEKGDEDVALASPLPSPEGGRSFFGGKGGGEGRGEKGEQFEMRKWNWNRKENNKLVIKLL